MNKKIQETNIESVLFFDAETVPANKELTMDSEEYNLFQYKSRNKETGELLEFKELNELYKKSAGLHPTYNRIVAIVVAFIRDGVVSTKKLIGDQKDIVNQFIDIANKSGATLVTYSGNNFDIPQIRLKSYQLDTENKLSDKYNDSGAKIWDLEKYCIDLFWIIKGTGAGNMSLAEVCYMLGIPTPKDDISGADVSRVFWEEGNIERIATYCEKDVIALIKLFIKLQGSKLEIKEIKERTEEPKKGLMEQITAQEHITEDQKKILLKETSKYSKKKKEGTIELLKASTRDNKEYEEFYEQIKGVNKS